MSKLTAVERKPFHESIVITIKGVDYVGELETISLILVSTKVPANHKMIISALQEKAEELNCPDMPQLGFAVKSLEEQEAEKREKEKEKS